VKVMQLIVKLRRNILTKRFLRSNPQP